MLDVFTHGGLSALFQVILIDIVLAGDNAVVIGLAAARVPSRDRARVIFWGLAAAVVLRVLLALITVSLLRVIGLMFAGGILLLWVCWRLWREIGAAHADRACGKFPCADEAGALTDRAHLRRAILHIAAADLSMSLDNVLAVAGAAFHHIEVLAIGLVLSIGLMGIAANYIAKFLQRHLWVSYAGILIVLYVAVRMIVHGGTMIVSQM